MEPEDLPWPGELEEEEEAAAAAEEEAGNLDQDEVSVVEEAEEEEGRELDADYESQPRESTDDEDDEEAKAWLQARPGATFPPPPLPKHRYLEGERTWPEKVSWAGARCGPPSGPGHGSSLGALPALCPVCLLFAACHGA